MKVFIEALWHVAKFFDMATLLKKLVQGGGFTSKISVSGSKFFGADLDLDPGNCLDPTFLTKLVQRGVLLQKSAFLDQTFLGWIRIQICTKAIFRSRSTVNMDPYDLKKST